MCGQIFNISTNCNQLQVETLRVINFKTNNHDARDLYKNERILKNFRVIKKLNCLFVTDVLTKLMISSFQNYFS